MTALEDRPPLPPQVLERLLNAPLDPGLHLVIAHVLAAMTPRERLRARDRYLERAAALLPAGPTYTRARALNARLKQLERTRRALPYDAGTIDGCLASALHVDERVPCVRTLRNLLAEIPGVDVSAADVRPVVHGEHPEGLPAHAPR